MGFAQGVICEPLNSFDSLKHSEHFKHSNTLNELNTSKVSGFYMSDSPFLKKLNLTRWNGWGGKQIEGIELLVTLRMLRVLYE